MASAVSNAAHALNIAGLPNTSLPATFCRVTEKWESSEDSSFIADISEFTARWYFRVPESNKPADLEGVYCENGFAHFLSQRTSFHTMRQPKRQKSSAQRCWQTSKVTAPIGFIQQNYVPCTVLQYPVFKTARLRIADSRVRFPL